MSTFNLYYDAEDSKQPFTIATSGANGLGEVVMNHIDDNGWNITGEESDADLEDFAREAVYSGNQCLEAGYDECGNPIELDYEMSYTGVLKAMTWVRDNASVGVAG